MRVTVAEGFRCSPIEVLNYKIEEVLYHLSYVIDKEEFIQYLTDKQKNKSL